MLWIRVWGGAISSLGVQVLCAVYCVLCTVCCVLCAVYCVLWTVCCVLCAVYCVLCTATTSIPQYILSSTASYKLQDEGASSAFANGPQDASHSFSPWTRSESAESGIGRGAGFGTLGFSERGGGWTPLALFWSSVWLAGAVAVAIVLGLRCRCCTERAVLSVLY
jgi:hypothetical protein